MAGGHRRQHARLLAACLQSQSQASSVGQRGDGDIKTTRISKSRDRELGDKFRNLARKAVDLVTY